MRFRFPKPFMIFLAALLGAALLSGCACRTTDVPTDATERSSEPEQEAQPESSRNAGEETDDSAEGPTADDTEIGSGDGDPANMASQEISPDESTAPSEETDPASSESVESTSEMPLPTPETSESPAPGTVVDPGIVRTDTTLYTYDMMVSDLHEIASRYPEHLTLHSAGTTADGRELYTVGFGNPDAPRSFLIVAATHGREYMTAQLVMKQIEYYAANYDNGAFGGRAFSEIFETNYFVVMPMVNPDGVSVSQLGEAGLRRDDLRAGLRVMYERDRANGYTTESYERYLVRWKANANGVDLNRNFSPGWESVSERTAPSSDFYKGTAPGSEAETQALMDLVNATVHLQAVVSYHSYGDLVYWQYGQPEPLWSENRVLAEHIRNHAGHYLAGYSNEAGFTNWCIRERSIRAVVVETGRVPTPLPLSEFPDLWNRHRETWAMLACCVETR